MAKRLRPLEIEAQETPEGMVTTPLFGGYNGVLRGSMVDGTSPELVGRRGRIWLYDDDRIAIFFQCVGWVGAAERFIVANAGSTIFSRGDSEGTLLAPNAAMPAAADLIQARKRRRISVEQKERLREMSRAYSPFVKASQEGRIDPKTATDAESAGPEREAP